MDDTRPQVLKKAMHTSIISAFVIKQPSLIGHFQVDVHTSLGA